MWAVIVCQNFENHCIIIINYNFLKIDQIYIEINFKNIPESLLFILFIKQSGVMKVDIIMFSLYS